MAGNSGIKLRFCVTSAQSHHGCGCSSLKELKPFSRHRQSPFSRNLGTDGARSEFNMGATLIFQLLARDGFEFLI